VRLKNLIRLVLARGWARVLRWQASPHPQAAGMVLVVSPHADDETLGCGGLLATRAEGGWPTHVVFLTDSAGTSPDAKVRQKQAEVRREEAWEALRVLGLKKEDASCLEAPDGWLDRLEKETDRRVREGLAALVQRLAPEAVYLPFLGSHSTEHEAAHRLSRQVLAECGWKGKLWEYPVWAWWNPPRFVHRSRGKPAPTCLTLGAKLETKRNALQAHRSQLEPGSKLPKILGRICLGRWEFFFPVPEPPGLRPGKAEAHNPSPASELKTQP